MRSGSQLLVLAVLRLYVPVIYMLLRNAGLSVSFLDLDALGGGKPYDQKLPLHQNFATSSVLSDHKTVGTAQDIDHLSRQELNKMRYISKGFIDEYNIRELLQASQYLNTPHSRNRNNFKPKQTLRSARRVVRSKTTRT